MVRVRVETARPPRASAGRRMDRSPINGEDMASLRKPVKADARRCTRSRACTSGHKNGAHPVRFGWRFGSIGSRSGARWWSERGV